MPSPYLQSPPRGCETLETQGVCSNAVLQATSSMPSWSEPRSSTPQFPLQAFPVSTPAALDSSLLTSFSSTSFAPISSTRQPSQQHYQSQQHAAQQNPWAQDFLRQPPVSTPSVSIPATTQAPTQPLHVPQSSRPIVCEQTSTPTDPTPIRKSFRKSMSTSIGKSFRSLSSFFDAMKVTDQAESSAETSKEAADKTVSEAMEETTQFLNGFSRTSAFKSGVDKAILKELDDVQAKYKEEQIVDDKPRRRGQSGRPPVQSFYGT
jgi:hypothetical protein